MISALSAKFNSWFEKPFDANGDAFSWTLFVGFILVVAFLWTRVLKHVTE